jgi:hypothetical protein
LARTTRRIKYRWLGAFFAGEIHVLISLGTSKETSGRRIRKHTWGSYISTIDWGHIRSERKPAGLFRIREKWHMKKVTGDQGIRRMQTILGHGAWRNMERNIGSPVYLETLQLVDFVCLVLSAGFLLEETGRFRARVKISR